MSFGLHAGPSTAAAGPGKAFSWNPNALLQPQSPGAEIETPDEGSE